MKIIIKILPIFLLAIFSLAFISNINAGVIIDAGVFPCSSVPSYYQIGQPINIACNLSQGGDPSYYSWLGMNYTIGTCNGACGGTPSSIIQQSTFTSANKIPDGDLVEYNAIFIPTNAYHVANLAYFIYGCYAAENMSSNSIPSPSTPCPTEGLPVPNNWQLRNFFSAYLYAQNLSVTLSASPPSTVSPGSDEVFAATAANGTPPYTYNFTVYNIGTNIILANDLTTSNTFTWDVPTNDSGKIFSANVIVNDSYNIQNGNCPRYGCGDLGISNSISPIAIAPETPVGSPFWAGYTALPPTPPDSINGSWIVEAAVPSLTAPITYGSQWIGLGGARNTNLLQIGTRSNYNLAGGSNYSVFYEEVNFSNGGISGGTPPLPINMLITPGDIMAASISLSGNTPEECISQNCKWILNITDITKNEYKSVNVLYDPNTFYADWIEEAFQFALGPLVVSYPLSHFGIANYGSKYTNIKNTNYVTINSIKYPMGTIPSFKFNLNSSFLGLATATPSNITANGTSFRVYGPSIPNLSVETPTSQYKAMNLSQFDHLSSGASGGTGYYRYQWLEETPGSTTFANASTLCLDSAPGTCPSTSFFSSGNSTGNYYFKLRVTDNATLETSNSSSVCIVITPYTIRNYSCAVNKNESYTESVSANSPTDHLIMTIANAIDPITVNGIGSVSYTICSSPSTCLPVGAYVVNVTDTNTLYSETWPLIVYYPPEVSVSPYNSVLDEGQQIYISANVVNGTGLFNYQWYNVTSGNYVPISNAIGSTYLLNATGSGTFKYSIAITDVGTSNTVTVESNNATVVVKPALSVNVTPANSIVLIGRTLAFNSLVSGGTGNFVYQWYNYSSNFYGIPIANQISNDLTIPFNSIGNFSYLLVVTDQGTTTSPKATTISTPVNISVEDPVLPRGVKNYLPITLLNYQNTAIASNTPIAIGTTNTFTGNVIGFNAIAYQQYETCNLDNAEFFFVNGTIISSWLEGNILNEIAANTLCTSSSSANALASSANILYWIDYPWPSSFLPANTGSNTIYLGWTGNVVGAANTLFGYNALYNSYTGEAPQLSCNNPSNTITGCTTGQYGEYDNGNSIFKVYYNFMGTATPSGLVTSGTYTQNNGIYIQSKKAATANTMTYYSPGTSNVFEGLIRYGGYPTAAGWGDFGAVAPGTNSCKKTNNGICWILTGEHAGVFQPEIGTVLGASVSPNTNWNVYSAYWPASTKGLFNFNYGATNTVIATASLSEPFGVSTAAADTNALSMQWIRIRQAPPNDILPGTVVGNVI